MPERTWTSDSVSYRYGFNTQEKDDEIYGAGNSYSAEYWQYDSRLGRRWNLDPKPQIMISDYACFGNNPINFIDLKGDEFDPASQKRVDKHKEKTEKRLKRFSQKVERLESKNNLTEKQSSKLEYYREAKKELNSALEEIYTLESSTQMYTLRKRGAHGHGGSLTYDPESDVVYITFDGSTDNLAHELKHAYQFEVKKISFSRSEDGEWSGGLLYDAQDELEAFRRGFAYNRNHTRRIGYPVYASSFDRITPNFIIRLGYNLPVHPGGIDRNTNAFEAWRSSTGGEELDPIYRTRTTLQLIREQNELSRQNEGRLWEKIKE
jgi:RHS repeat-associated protein